MTDIRYATAADEEFWFSLDRHLAKSEFENIAALKRGYILIRDETPIGILRYNLFWDSIPFCTLLFIKKQYRGQGCGKELMSFWESEMKTNSYGMIMTSTQADEDAQHFYRKLGYHDAGSLIISVPGYEQPMEIFLIKSLK